MPKTIKINLLNFGNESEFKTKTIYRHFAHVKYGLPSVNKFKLRVDKRTHSINLLLKLLQLCEKWKFLRYKVETFNMMKFVIIFKAEILENIYLIWYLPTGSDSGAVGSASFNIDITWSIWFSLISTTGEGCLAGSITSSLKVAT